MISCSVVHHQAIRRQAAPSRRQVLQIVSDRAHISRKNVAVAIRRLVMNQFRKIHPHLVAGLDALLQFVLLPAIVIVQREQGVGGAGAEIGDGGNLVMGGICPPLAAGKGAAAAIGESRFPDRGEAPGQTGCTPSCFIQCRKVWGKDLVAQTFGTQERPVRPQISASPDFEIA